MDIVKDHPDSCLSQAHNSCQCSHNRWIVRMNLFDNPSLPCNWKGRKAEFFQRQQRQKMQECLGSVSLCRLFLVGVRFICLWEHVCSVWIADYLADGENDGDMRGDGWAFYDEIHDEPLSLTNISFSDLQCVIRYQHCLVACLSWHAWLERLIVRPWN